MKTSSNKYTFAVGKRKDSSARLRLFKGAGENMVNGKKVEAYFNNKLSQLLISKPFKLTNTEGKYFFTVKTVGGGKEGQLEAIIHSIARAFAKLDPEKYREVLKRAGFLTRDSRRRLRRMVGTGGKARRQKQSPKR